MSHGLHPFAEAGVVTQSVRHNVGRMLMFAALDNALLFAACGFKVDDLLTRDVAGFKEVVRKRVVEIEIGRAHV